MVITQTRLRELFIYDPETGVVTRRITTSSRAKAGHRVGTADGAGYLQVSIAGRNYRLHRLICMYVNGVWPEHDVDHRDRNRANNRWKNLRISTRAENAHNKNKSTNNTSGYLGVSWSSTMRQWEARIGHNGKSLVLGYFLTPLLASAAYLAAKAVYHPTSPV